MSKRLIESRTFWANVIIALLAALDSLFNGGVLPIDADHYAALIAFVNIGLRIITTQPVTLK